MVLETIDPSTLVLTLASAAFLVILLSNRKKYQNLPPGPPALPIVGNLLTFMNSKTLFKDLAELSKKYGAVMKVKLGTHDVFVLSGYDVMKEAMVEKANTFSERPRWMNNIKIHSREKAGIFFHFDWRRRRRFVLVSMRDFGLGKRSLEEGMVEEAGFLMEELQRAGGEPTDLSTLLSCVTANIICRIIVGHRFSYGDETFNKLLRTVTGLVSGSPQLSIQNFVPFCKYLPTPDFKAKIQDLTQLLGMCAHWKEEHLQSFDPDNIRDLIDLFLAEQRKDGTQFDDKDLVATVLELFIAGTETTSTTLSWALLLLIHNLEVQDKCRQEIHEVVGTNRPPVYADMKNTPYVNAVMNEVQRISNIVPLSIWHATCADVELGGFTIPKDHIVLMNMDTALKDPKYWPDPSHFRPDRWLDSAGRLTKNQAFIPFSLGKRVCLGEQLARKEFYIFLTTMLQKFRFTMANEKSPPSLQGMPGNIHMPGPYKLRAVKI